MNENQSGSGSLLDTTDCLEAVGVFKGWKNYFFVIIVLCILLLQGCFWILDTGLIKIPAKQVPPQLSGGINIPANIDGNIPAGIEGQMPKTELPKTDEPVSTPPEPNQEKKPVLLIAETTIAAPNDQSSTAQSSEKEFLLGITFEQIKWVMRFVNTILILTAVMYCLTMLFSLKISMLGRLGGINHITRAFFLSFIMVIILLPWQKIFGNMILGAVFTPDELIDWQIEKTGDMINMILYYMRFCGYMVLVFLFLILAQIRSCRWAKAILRRLEII